MIPKPEKEECAQLRQLIAWAACGAVEHPVARADTDWPELVRLAARQHVLPLVGCALIRDKDRTCPEQIREMLTELARRTSAENMIRRQRMVHLLHEMRTAGVDALVLKGYAAAAYYAYPECRDSADVDLLIEARQERKAAAFLKAQGFSVEARAATSQHAVCVHPQYGKIELHVSLYAELVREVWFQDRQLLVCEQPVLCHTPDGAFSTLGYTDHLIFLTLHMMKHFIESGLTIQMMLDIALFFSRNAQRIDAGRFWRVMREQRVDTVINSLLWIMIRCGGFSAAHFPGVSPQEPAQTEALLNDLAQGGYMGALQREKRYEAGMEYGRRRMLSRKNPLQYRAYMLRWKIRTGSKYMFMSYERLSGLYPWLRKAAVLYPLVWLYQAVAYPVSKVKSGVMKKEIRSGPAQMDPEAERRVALFEALNML